MILKNLSKRFNDKVLFENLNLKINKGVLYIKGESGCGKTTLINIIMGIEKPTKGSVIFENEESFSYCGNESLLFLEESLIKNLKMFNIKYSSAELDKYALIFNVKTKVNTPLYKLSGGERKKCELIYSILKKANIYIFDEPIVSLDSNSKEEFLRIIQALAKSHLVILINHESNKVNIKYNTQIIFANESIEIIKKMNDNFLLEPIKRNKAKSFFFTLKNYFLNFKLDILITSALMLICLSLFVGGCCLYDSKSYADKNLISLKEDPFLFHSLRVNDSQTINENFFTKTKGFYSLCVTSKEDNTTIYQKKEKQHPQACKFMFVEFLNAKEKTIYIYQANINKKLDSKRIILNSNVYNLEIINQEFINNKYDYSFELADAFDHNTYDYVLLTPYSFIDEILINGLRSLKFEDDTFDFIDLPGINTSTGVFKHASNNIIVDNTIDGYYVATSNKKIDKLVIKDSLNNIYEEIYNVSYDNNINDNIVVMSLNSYKDFLFHVLKFNQFYYSTDYQGYIDSLNYGNFVPNNIIISTTYHFYDKSIFLFLLSLIVFLVLLIYKLFSINGKVRYYRYILSIYNHNEIRKNRFFFELLLNRLLPFLFFTIILIILYKSVFLNLSNYYLMISTHKAPFVNGIKYGYYSMQSENNYYDLITNPIKFFTFEPVIYCILLFSLYYVAYIVRVYMITKKANTTSIVRKM